LLARLLEYLAGQDGVRLLGPDDARERAATVAFVPLRRPPADLVPLLAARGIMAGAGHFYAVRLLEAMGVDPNRGTLRLSFVHYTSQGDVDRVIAALDVLLDR
jgi:selenocysteine lyase/cysteine desulfurase